MSTKDSPAAISRASSLVIPRAFLAREEGGARAVAGNGHVKPGGRSRRFEPGSRNYSG
jgi:hypothetical protein